MEQEQIQQYIYDYLKDNEKATSIQLIENLKIDANLFISAMKSIEALQVIQTQIIKKDEIELTQLGKDSLQNKTQSYRLFEFVKENNGMHKEDLIAKFGQEYMQQALPEALKRRLVATQSSGKKDPNPMIVVNEQNTLQSDDIQEQLKTLDKQTPQALKILQKCKYIQTVQLKYFEIEKGKNYSRGIKKPQTSLTINDVANSQSPYLKDINTNTLGLPAKQGNLHPLTETKMNFISILTSLGFKQMNTANYVIPAFYNFDCLMVEQEHPAREAQDTFYVKDLSGCDHMDQSKFSDSKKFRTNYSQLIKDLEQEVKRVALGYNCIYKEETARQLTLRTHTTPDSIINLIHQELPQKYFSIDRVFRNETLDATHLAEFQQIEGVVIDKNLGLPQLIWIIKTVFAAFGLSQVKLHSCYNPYTAPSFEIFAYHEGLGRFIEVGNSGIFRPEILKSLGYDEDVQAVAWGLSLERPFMVTRGINNIRDIVGWQQDLEGLSKVNPVSVM